MLVTSKPTSSLVKSCSAFAWDGAKFFNSISETTFARNRMGTIVTIWNGLFSNIVFIIKWIIYVIQ